MAIIKGLEWTFDTVAATYEKLRPGYSDELYEMIFNYTPINQSSNVVEVGIGGGQATLPILKTGCNLTAVEYGEQFSVLCREKFKTYPNFKVVTDKFELTDFENSVYDLVYSASAFHWVPEEIGYSKVFSMLKKGGVFARFANHPSQDKGKPALSKEIEDIYAQYYYKFFSANEYITLLGTYSDHIIIEEKIRNRFFTEIEEAINRHDGQITIYDTMDLQLARKR